MSAYPMIGDMTIERLVAACEELRVDALHNLSLGSKELFHSNFLAWFAQGYPEAAAEVFRAWVEPGDHGPGPTAERERAHLDLVLRLPHLRLIVVENKVWSLPDDTQLARYSAGPVKKLAKELAKEGADPPTPILLSLSPPEWDGPACTLSGYRWVYLSYPELARGLERAAGRLLGAGNTEDRFAGELLHRYVALVERLCRVAGEVSPVSPSEPVWLDDRSRAALKDARVYDGMSKLRGRRVLSFVLEQLCSASPAPEVLTPDEAVGFKPGAGWQFLRLGRRVAGLEVNFTNSMPLLSGMVALESSGDKLFWQYQGSQWRLTVATARYQGRDDATRALREAYVAERYRDRGWFDFAPVKDLLGTDRGTPVPVKGGGQFNRFDPDSAYRHARVDQDGHWLTVSELAKLGVYYLHRAASWPEQQ